MEIITVNPHVANGEPCIRDTGFTVKQLQKLIITASDQEIIAAYPYLNFLDIQAVRALNGERPKVAVQKYYTGEDMMMAYQTVPHYPFDEWIDAFDKGVILHPPVVEEKGELPPPIIDNPNEQNLPIETKAPQTDI